MINGIYLKRIIPPAPDPYAPIDGNTFTWDGFEYKVIVKNGLAWLDRNLGASRAATASNDSDAYGDLYQWGRLTDGHEKRTSGTTATLATSDDPEHGDFILVNAAPNNWRNPKNDDLWQGVDGINNPAPSGWRLPTSAELNAERLTWATNNAAGAYASVLKWVINGVRLHTTGAVSGAIGWHWSSTIASNNANYLFCSVSSAFISPDPRAFGMGVRLVRDIE
jgi:uncharacterized protein (TIGR02145 family)